MLNRIKFTMGSATKGAIASATNSAILSVNQPKLAPVAFGGSIIAGVVALLLGSYKIADCFRYQQERGQCDSAIEINLPGVITGAATILGSWGAFNTFNPALREETICPPVVAPRELVLTPDEVPTPAPPAPVPAAIIHPDVVKNLHLEGNSQVKIADMLGITVYAVKKILNEAKEASAKEETTTK